MDKFILRQSLLLFLTAVIWGIAFVAQDVGVEYVSPFTFNAVRSLIGSVVLIPCIGFLEKSNGAESGGNKQNKTLLMGGLACGVLLFIASNLQQFGIMYTTAGKAGFITAMYIVIVPVLGIFLHKKVGLRVWVAVAVAAVGMYLLCGMSGSFSLQAGDAFLLGCAVTFSFHIIVIDYFSPKVSGIKLSCIQFFVCAVLSGICMLIFEDIKISSILDAKIPILYAGVFSCGAGYTLQVVGQKGVNPAAASLILSLESVVSVIAGWVILGQRLSERELCGCALVFAAVILVQLPSKRP